MVGKYQPSFTNKDRGHVVAPATLKINPEVSYERLANLDLNFLNIRNVERLKFQYDMAVRFAPRNEPAKQTHLPK